MSSFRTSIEKNPDIVQILSEQGINVTPTFEWTVAHLVYAIDRCADKGRRDKFRATALVQAVAELNKMMGFYAPEKKRVDLSEYDLEEVEKLIKKHQKDY